MIYIRYQDDGPVGICGQACSITNPWDQLHIFADDESAREFARRVENSRFRRNSRITATWRDDQDGMYPTVRKHYEEDD